MAVEPLARVAFAEADILTGMRAIAAGFGKQLYSAGLSTSRGSAERRMTARLGDLVQRRVLCDMFGVADDELEQRMSESYAQLTAGAHGGGRYQLFSAA